MSFFSSLSAFLSRPTGRTEDTPLDRNLAQKIFAYAFHPLMIVCALVIPRVVSPETSALVVFFVLLPIILIAERVAPAKGAWQSSVGDSLQNAVVWTWLYLVLLTPWLSTWYGRFLIPLTAPYAETLGLAQLWPHHWPAVPKVLLLMLVFDLQFYWIHRTMHKVSGLWRITGHIVHHSPNQLNSLVNSVTHPIETPWMFLPWVVILALLQVGESEIDGYIRLAFVTTSLTHANLALKPLPPFSWFFTATRHHWRHHSPAMEENNSNYGCILIIWDRLFGTFVDSNRGVVGIGEGQPTLLERNLLPFRLPRWMKPRPALAQAASRE
jgi:sterol desaturase/sphingolipid hydroxylase (fatty acid hydroxylase superfamily)